MNLQKNYVNIILGTGGAWEIVNGVLEYLPLQSSRRAVRLPIRLNFVSLVKFVAEQSSLNTKKEFKFFYKICSYPHPIEIQNDDDVILFIETIVTCPTEMFTLFVVQQITPQYTTRNFDRIQQFSSNHPFSSYEPYHTYNYHLYQHDNEHQYLQHDDVFKSEDHYVAKMAKKDHPFKNPDITNYIGEEEEDDDDDDEFVKGEEDDDVFLKDEVGVSTKKQKSNFFCMPDPLVCPDPKFTLRERTSYGSCSKVIEGKFYKDKEELQVLLGLKAIEERFQFKVTQSTRLRFEAKCVSKGCKWHLRATKLDNSSVFYVAVLEDQHSCSRTQMHPHHRNANKKVLGHLIKEQMRDCGRIYRGNEIKRDLKTTYKLDISYSQAWRGKCYALRLLRGSEEDSFAELPYYCHNLKLANPGTVTYIETDDVGRFEHLFVAIGAPIRSFREQLRPMIIIDGAHLKGHFGGTNLLAVSMDGNNQILPLAYGVGKTESGVSWTWFLRKLKECIGEKPGLAIISDRAPAIAMAIRDVFPQAYHGLCCRHLMVNLKLNSERSRKHQMLCWKACKAYMPSDFEDWMHRLRCAVPSVTNTLAQIGFGKWARAHYPGNRYNTMTSNSVESMNSLSRHARRLPITMLVEFFRESVQKWYYIRREAAANLDQELTSWAEKKVVDRIRKSETWEVYGIDKNKFEVDDGGKKGLVDFSNKTCSCRKWQLSGLPCGHVIAAGAFLGETECSQWAMSWFTKSVYQATYEEVINPVPHKSEWKSPDKVVNVRPPLMDKRQPGRPRNKDRIPSRGEEKIPTECSRCGQSGHRKDKCILLVASESLPHHLQNEYVPSYEVWPSYSCPSQEQYEPWTNYEACPSQEQYEPWPNYKACPSQQQHEPWPNYESCPSESKTFQTFDLNENM